jgi:hypothetical protein
MAEKKRSVINTLTNCIVFIGTLRECSELVISDKSGFLELVL